MANKAYNVITDQLIELIEETGQLPWNRPWCRVSPQNPSSGTVYSGVNALILDMVTSSKGYTYPLYVTYKQSKKLGGHVKKGEKSTAIIYWQMFYKEKKTGKKVPKSEVKNYAKSELDTIPVLRYYRVFNIEQCEGLDVELPEAPVNDFTPVEQGEKIMDGYADKPYIHLGGSRACYNLFQDVIKMPQPETFKNPELYYCTLFHEAVHSTGAKSRLNRFGDDFDHGDLEDYSKEELVAEIGAAFLCHEAQIDVRKEHHAGYLKSWVRKLKDEPTLIVHASSKAEKAVSYILGE